MIKAVKGAGNANFALCGCDGCAAEVSIPAEHSSGRGAPLTLEQPGRVIKIITGRGWVSRGAKLYCPKCEAARRGKAEQGKGGNVAENVAPLRQASREQKREIAKLLDDVYDAGAGRYRGGDTDKTVADVLGDGVLPGWVAAVREEFYGPDGGNESIDEVLADLRAWREAMDARAVAINAEMLALQGKLREFSADRERVSAFEKSLRAIREAFGPKAVRL